MTFGLINRATVLLAVLAFFKAALAPMAHAASSFTSSYDKIKVTDCPIIEEGERHAVRRCALPSGLTLAIEFSEHSTDVYLEPAFSDGTYNASNAYQTSRSGHFGSLFENDKQQVTFEIRASVQGGETKPFALIYRTRYNHLTDEGENQTRNRLEVLKFGADHACQIGVVEGSEPNHNEKARALADAAFGKNPC